MARPAADQPTDVELAILEVLWNRGPSTVRAVHDALSVQRSTGYSTTLKMLQVMLEKGLVRRDDNARPQLYAAAKSQRRTQKQLLDNLAQKAFGGSAKRLIVHVLSNTRISKEDLAEIRRLIKEAEGTSHD